MIDEVCKSCTGDRYSERQFKMKFGTSKYVCGLAWDAMTQSDYNLSEDKVEIKDLLKGMHFLKVYSTEENLCGLFNVLKKHFCI